MLHEGRDMKGIAATEPLSGWSAFPPRTTPEYRSMEADGWDLHVQITVRGGKGNKDRHVAKNCLGRTNIVSARANIELSIRFLMKNLLFVL
jgi:hypothetical protein